MAKEIVKVIKLQIPAGKANPAPPIGPALGANGVNIMAFCKEFNAKTQDRAGQILPTVIYVYKDKSFSFITKQPPMAVMIKGELGIESGSGTPNKTKVGKLTKAQVRKIAEAKSPDLRFGTLEAAIAMVEGTARSMGVEIEKAEA